MRDIDLIKYKYFFGMLFLALLAVFFIVKNSSNDRKQIFIIGKQYMKLTLDSDFKLLKKTFYSDKVLLNNERRDEIIQIHNKNEWIIITRGTQTIVSKLSIKNDKIHEKIIYNGKRFFDRYENFLEVGSNNLDLITGRGNIYHYDSGKYEASNNQIDPDLWDRIQNYHLTKQGRNNLFNKAVVYIDKDRVFFQASETLSKNNAIRPLLRNWLFLLSVKENGINDLKSGFAPLTRPLPDYLGDISLPVALSPQRDKISFLAKFPDTNKENEDQSIAPIYLCLYYLEKNKAEKIVSLNCNAQYSVFTRILPLKWNPAYQKELIAFSVSGRSKQEKTTEKTLLIDTEKKKTVKEWPWESKCLRWSPDGRYLGMLKMESRSSKAPKNKKEAGSLCIYDLKTDTLKKIDQDKTYFDFYWLD